MKQDYADKSWLKEPIRVTPIRSLLDPLDSPKPKFEASARLALQALARWEKARWRR